MPREILFEGLTSEAILKLPPQQIEQLVLTGEPVIFTAGSARILGEFRRSSDRLNVTLAQIEGGGEGVLPALTMLIEKFARSGVDSCRMGRSCSALFKTQSQAEARPGTQRVHH